jgi:hypothetical protein
VRRKSASDVAADTGPSVIDKWVCSSTAATAIASVTGTPTVDLERPNWSNGTYSCVYAFAPGASAAVAVTDFPNKRAATPFFDEQRALLGNAEIDPHCSGACAIGNQDGHALFLAEGGPTSPDQVQVLVVDASRLRPSLRSTNRETNAFAVLAAVSPP